MDEVISIMVQENILSDGSKTYDVILGNVVIYADSKKAAEHIASEIEFLITSKSANVAKVEYSY